MNVTAEKVVLRGKTRHGKNRLNQHGETWIVIEEKTFQGQPAIRLRSTKKTEGQAGKKGFDTRWVLIDNDRDFEIVDTITDDEINQRLALMEQAEINAGRY